jgi:nucleotide-binding universal stress UspA family protein
MRPRLDLAQALVYFRDRAGRHGQEENVVKVLLAVDGSESSTNATRKLIDSLDGYKERPQIDLLTVHLPVPHLPRMRMVVTPEMLDQYDAEESDAMLAASRAALDAAGVTYTVHRRVGPVAEGIVEEARQCGSDLIYMGSRGMSALSNMVLGSVTTRVLHLTHIPVVLVH